MVALRFESRSRRRNAVLFAVALFAAFTLAMGSAAALDAIKVALDQAKLIKLPERASTVVVGNPLIADVSLQSGGVMVVTGKGYGVTNIIALDRAGAVLVERSIEVRGPTDNVVVIYRGVERETYSCLPKCEPRITLGDAPNYFNPTIAQIGTRNGQAQGIPAAR